MFPNTSWSCQKVSTPEDFIVVMDLLDQAPVAGAVPGRQENAVSRNVRAMPWLQDGQWVGVVHAAMLLK